MAKKTKQANKKPLSEEAYVKKFARTLPVEMCEMTFSHTNPHTVRVLVVRREPTGLYTVGFYLVDSWCRGIYDTYCRAHITQEQLDEILNIDKEYREIVPMTYDEAHNYIFGAIEYGEEAGFDVPKEFKISQYVLAEDTDDIPLISYEFGLDGKRVLECSTTEQFNRARNVLERNLSPDQYILLGVTGFDDDDEEYDEDSDEPDYDEIDDKDLEKLEKFVPAKIRPLVKLVRINYDNFEELDDKKFVLSLSMISSLYQVICDEEDTKVDELPAEIATYIEYNKKVLDNPDNNDLYNQFVDSFFEAFDSSRHEILRAFFGKNQADSDMHDDYVTFFLTSAVVYTKVLEIKKKDVDLMLDKSGDNIDKFMSFTKKCMEAYLELVFE